MITPKNVLCLLLLLRCCRPTDQPPDQRLLRHHPVHCHQCQCGTAQHVAGHRWVRPQAPWSCSPCSCKPQLLIVAAGMVSLSLCHLLWGLEQGYWSVFDQAALW